MLKFAYKKILRPILFKTDPEFIHDRFIEIGEFLGKYTLAREIISGLYQYKGQDIAKTVDDILYKTPIILAAGFDYNARLTQVLQTVSFGGVEVGTITARPCEGNSKPRLTRLVRSKSIVVWKGLRNDGVEKIISRLKARHSQLVVGVSIGRTNDKRASSTQAGIADYLYSLKRLTEEDIGNYYTINISCPNAYGGESFTNPVLLGNLLGMLSKIKDTKPRYIKMPINLNWKEFDKLLQIINCSDIRGVVIGNLNKNYSDLDYPEEAPSIFRGGLSGKPCFKLSNELIKKTRDKYGDRFTIIGCGGISSPQDALEKFKCGADLIELISGMIFEGPQLMKEICMFYSEMMKTK